MDVGTGIAIGGVWLFVGACALSNTVNGLGLWVGIIAAGIVTAVVI